jgi:hypothetical protein
MQKARHRCGRRPWRRIAISARPAGEPGLDLNPYLARLLDLSHDELDRFRSAARRHDRRSLPGAVRASAGISTTLSDLERLVEAVEVIASAAPPVQYVCDPRSGDYWPASLDRPDAALGPTAGCRRG